MLITFEGIDGSGKSTQAKMLAERLQIEFGSSKEVVLTREPGGCPSSLPLRQLALSDDKLCGETKSLLFAAAFVENQQKLIKPSLERGAIVICDRYSISARVYNTVVHQIDHDKLSHVYAQAALPDIVFFIDTCVEVAYERVMQRYVGDEFNLYDRLSLDCYYEIYNETYKESTHLWPEIDKQIAIVDGTNTREQIAEEIYTITQLYLNRR